MRDTHRDELESCKRPRELELEGNPFANGEHAAVAKGTLALSREAANGCISQGLAPGGSMQGVGAEAGERLHTHGDKHTPRKQ